MTNSRVYIRAVGDRGKPFRKLDGGFDGDVSIGFWSKDGNTIYFNEGMSRDAAAVRARRAIRTRSARSRSEQASLSVTRDDDSGAILINYSDGRDAADASSSAPSIEQVAQQARRGCS